MNTTVKQKIEFIDSSQFNCMQNIDFNDVSILKSFINEFVRASGIKTDPGVLPQRHRDGADFGLRRV